VNIYGIWAIFDYDEMSDLDDLTYVTNIAHRMFPVKRKECGNSASFAKPVNGETHQSSH
jgi:hypothetical protein